MIKMFPPSLLERLARDSGAVVRRRKVAPHALFWTVVFGFGVGRKRTIAGLRRSYEKATGQTIEESSFYNRFSEGFARMLRAAVALALDSLPGIGRALRGPLAAFRDLVVTDSTVMRLRDLLQGPFPACRTNHTKAALKMHAVLSVTGAGDNSIKITAERRHDGPVFRVGRWVRGKLLLFDLGYYRYQLFACITRNSGWFVSRLKRSANPLIVSVNRAHRGRAIELVGRRLNDVLDELTREVLDVMVEVSFARRLYGGHRSRASQRLRVVGVRDPETKQYHLYITNLPPEKLAAEDIQRVYAARWEVAVASKGRTTQSVKVRPRLKRSRPRSTGGGAARKQDAEALRQHSRKGGCATPQVATCSERECSLVTRIPVAETVYNVRRQHGPAERGLTRRSTPAGYQRRHGAKGGTETGETLGVRRRNPAEEARPITVSGKWKGWHQGVGSGHGTVDPRAAKRAGRDGPGPAGTPFVEVRQG
jgi:IS4 transposase